MKYMLFIFCLVISNLCFISTSNGINYEQIVLDRFINYWWNERIFDGECSGIKYNKNYGIRINSDSGTFELDNRELSGFLGSPLLLKDSRNEKFNLDISKYRILKKTGLSRAPFEVEGVETLDKERDFILVEKKFNAYFLRISRRLEINGKVYLGIWIKEGYYSSGVKIIFELDQDGHIIRENKIALCDDWG